MSRGRLFGSLCGLVFLVNLARVVFAPLLSTFIDVFGIGEATAGLVVSLVWFGSALPRIPTGWVLTRVRRVTVVIATGAVLTCAATFTAAADSVAVLGAGALLMGLASGAYFVAANPLVSELYRQRTGRALGVHGTASQLAAVLAAPIVALALLVSWRAAFVGIAVAAALVTAALLLTSRAADLPSAGAGDRDLLGAARSQWRVIATGLAVLGVAGFVWQGVFNFYELYLTTRGIPERLAPYGLTIIFAAGVPAFLVSGRLADRLPHVPYLTGLLVLFGGGLVALPFAEGLAALTAVTVLLGYAIHSVFPALDTYLLETLPDSSRASAYAIYSGLMMFVQAPGSWVVGGLIERGVTYSAVFAGFAGLVLASGAALWMLYRRGRVPTPGEPVPA